MQPWQIKALQLEASGFKHLDGFFHEHALYFLMGVIYLLLALLVWKFSGALRGKREKSVCRVRPFIFINLTGPRPPPSEPPFDPFPPYRESSQCDCNRDDHYHD